MTDRSLWIFGDSFASAPEETGHADKAWTKQVAEALGCDTYRNYAMPGVSNDYIFHHLSESINKMAEGDYCIIQTTQKHRQWFFNDPTLANYSIGDLGDYITKDQAKAIEYYITHLQSDSLDHTRFIQFSLALERIASLVKHVRFLILPGFWGAHGVTGTMITVCDNEFISVEGIADYYNSGDRNGKDPRCNHMSPVNHKVMADKVVDFFTTGKFIDLTTGFEQHFLDTRK